MAEVRLTAIPTGRGQGLHQFLCVNFVLLRFVDKLCGRRKRYMVNVPLVKLDIGIQNPCLRSGINVFVMCSLVVTAVLYWFLYDCIYVENLSNL